MKKKPSSHPECQLVGVRSIGLLAFFCFLCGKDNRRNRDIKINNLNGNLNKVQIQ